MPPPEAADDDSRRSAGFRQIGEREKVASSFVRLVTGTFVGPDGYTFERDIVRHLGAVCVVPLEADGDTVRCVRQYRAPLDSEVLELPAGKLDVPGENRLAAAKRELAEEAGVEATRWSELGSFYNSPGFTDEQTWCFLAEGLSEVGTSFHGIEEQHMALEQIRLGELFSLVASGKLRDAKTIIALALTAELLARRGPEGEPGA